MTDRAEPGAAGPQDRLLVVLRATASTNEKNRPEWFDKERCIRSIRDAADHLRALGGEVHLLCLPDESGGALPAPIASAVADWDEVVPIRGGSARRSWKAMLAVLHERYPTTPFDTVYLVEDDHLHERTALEALASRPGGFSLLYSHQPDGSSFTADGRAARFGRHEWREARSGVSSFAMGRGEYLRSRRVLRVMSNANQSWDHLTWQVLRGPRALTGAFVLEAFAADFGHRAWHPRTVYNVLWRLVGFVWARLRRGEEPWAVIPNLATHAETENLSPGVDWAAVSDGVTRAGPRSGR